MEKTKASLRHTWGICCTWFSWYFFSSAWCLCTSPTTPAAIQVSSTKQEVGRLVEKSVGLNHFLELQQIHYIDNGGQPQFQEVLPAFICNTTITIFGMKLSERFQLLNIMVSFVVSLYTIHFVMIRCFSTAFVQCYPAINKGGESFKVFLVGTHSDPIRLQFWIPSRKE